MTTPVSSPLLEINRRWPYQGKVVKLAVDTVEAPNGNRFDLEVIHHPGAAAIVPLDANGEVLLVRQYRHATGEWLLEVPAGKLDSGEEPRACAARELVEEVGFAAGELVDLGFIWTTPGFTNEKIWLFLARDLVPAVQDLQEDELLTVERWPLDVAVEMALGGDIRDAKSVCALVRAQGWVGLTTE